MPRGLSIYFTLRTHTHVMLWSLPPQSHRWQCRHPHPAAYLSTCFVYLKCMFTCRSKGLTLLSMLYDTSTGHTASLLLLCPCYWGCLQLLHALSFSVFNSQDTGHTNNVTLPKLGQQHIATHWRTLVNSRNSLVPIWTKKLDFRKLAGSQSGQKVAKRWN